VGVQGNGSAENDAAPILVKPAEAARLIRVSVRKLYQLLAAGKIPSVRLDGGRLLRVPRAALEQLAAQAVKGEVDHL
jgi:excisionase family DNA binding protein